MKSLIYFLLLFLFFGFVSADYTGEALTADFNVLVDAGIIVDYEKFRDSEQTSSLLYYSDSDLANISSLTLSDEDFGRITFLENINLTVDVVDNFVNLSKNVEILDKYFYVNSSALTSFSKPSLILSKGITYNDPLILRNGEVCPESMCSIISYIKPDLVFTVQSFSTYYIMENPNFGEDDEGDSSSGGGGGTSTLIPSGGGTIYEDSSEIDLFNLSGFEAEINSKIGDSFRNSILVENFEDYEIEVGIIVEGINKFMHPSESVLKLGPREEKEIYFEYNFPLNSLPGIYKGEIIFFSGPIKKIIEVFINLNEENSPLDLELTLFKEEYSVLENVLAKVEVIGLKGEEGDSALVYYAIRDLEGNVIVSKSEMIDFEGKTTFTKKLRIPYFVEEGEYLFYLGIKYNNKLSFTSGNFLVKNKGFFDLKNLLIGIGILIGLIVLLLILIFFIYYKRFLKRKR